MENLPSWQVTPDSMIKQIRRICNDCDTSTAKVERVMNFINLCNERLKDVN
jgi:hypothetical protein